MKFKFPAHPINLWSHRHRVLIPDKTDAKQAGPKVVTTTVQKDQINNNKILISWFSFIILRVTTPTTSYNNNSIQELASIPLLYHYCGTQLERYPSVISGINSTKVKNMLANHPQWLMSS